MAPSKGMEDKDNPSFSFSGETKDWPAFKDATQLLADKTEVSPTAQQNGGAAST
jgi:hypothetical protein